MSLTSAFRTDAHPNKDLQRDPPSVRTVLQHPAIRTRRGAVAARPRGVPIPREGTFGMISMGLRADQFAVRRRGTLPPLWSENDDRSGDPRTASHGEKVVRAGGTGSAEGRASLLSIGPHRVPDVAVRVPAEVSTRPGSAPVSVPGHTSQAAQDHKIRRETGNIKDEKHFKQRSAIGLETSGKPRTP
jgi:hypothetical protein